MILQCLITRSVAGLVHRASTANWRLTSTA